MKLADICKINMGQSPDSSTYNKTQDGLPFFQGNADFGASHPIPRVWCNSPVKVANVGDILISVRAPIGALNIADCECCIGRGLAALSANQSVCKTAYLWYAIASKVNELVAQGTGTTFKAISKAVLEQTELPVPPLSEQVRIASILDTVNALIISHKQQLAKLDELVKARFVEMFGTYPANEKGWQTGEIRDIVQDVRYGSSRPAVDGGAYPYLRMNNITYDGRLDLSNVKQIDVPENELDKCTVQRGDVLFNRTNSKELVGKTCVYNRDDMMVLAGFVIRVRVNERATPEFLSAFLNTDFSKHMLFEMCKTAIGQANINAQEMQSVAIYIPPLELQKQFSIFVETVEKSRLTIRRGLDKMETLKWALMQEYFGE